MKVQHNHVPGAGVEHEVCFLQLETDRGAGLDWADSPNVKWNKTRRAGSLPCFWRKVLAGLWHSQGHTLKSLIREPFSVSLNLARFLCSNSVSDSKRGIIVVHRLPRGLEDSLLCNVANQGENLKLHFSVSLSAPWSWFLLTPRAVQTCYQLCLAVLHFTAATPGLCCSATSGRGGGFPDFFMSAMEALAESDEKWRN